MRLARYLFFVVFSHLVLYVYHQIQQYELVLNPKFSGLVLFFSGCRFDFAIWWVSNMF